MRKLLLIFPGLLLLAACKKNSTTPVVHGTQLFPLNAANKWIYIDSFYDVEGNYIGKDTFYLKPAATIPFNGHNFTPLTDQFDEPIFTVSSDDSTVFMLKPVGDCLLFSWPMTATESYISNSYYGDSLSSTIYTTEITTTNYPSYKIQVTQDDGYWMDYKQEEFYFSIGLGIIKGSTRWKNSDGSFYTTDRYNLISFTIN